jgi:hypothetical protein
MEAKTDTPGAMWRSAWQAGKVSNCAGARTNAARPSNLNIGLTPQAPHLTASL